MNDDHDLIDTTEMYLRTVLELEEEKLIPLRARIAERLQQSVPTVSETVARMQRAGLLMVAADRSVQLTAAGRQDAVRVMRKHRIAECMLVDVLGLEWQLVHVEACRFEHVISEAVERRVLDLLGHPTVSPYGNPIPGLAELGQPDGAHGPAAVPLSTVPDDVDSVVVRRIAEPIQADTVLLTRLRRAGFWPDAIVAVSRADGHLRIGAGGGVEIDDATAAHIFVTPSRRPSQAAS